MIFALPLLISAVFIAFIGIVIGNGYLMVHDSSIYTNIVRANRDVLQLWSENSYGYSNYIATAMNFFSSILSFLGLKIYSEIKYFQLTYYFLILNVIWYSAWYAINKICTLFGYGKSVNDSLLISGFYACNLYMICSWHGGTFESLWVMYALSPLIFLGAMKILYGIYSQIDVAWLGVFCGLSIYSGPYGLATLLTIGFSLLLFWRQSFSKLLKVISIVSFFFILSGAPFIFLSIQTFLNGDRTPYIDIYSLRTFSQYGLKGLFQFWYEWTMLEFWRGRYFHSYIEYYKNPIIISTAFILWVAFLLMIRNTYHNHRSKMIYVGFLLSVVVIGLFFAKANQAPFGVVNLLLYKYWPLMGVFRTPDTKFGLPIISALAIGLAIFMLSEKRKLLRYTVMISIFAQIIIFFTPLPLIEKKAEKTFSRIVHIPPEYIELSHLINAAPESGSLLMLPPIQQDVFDFQNGYGIAGKDVLGEMVNRPIFYVGGFTYGKTYQKYQQLLATAKTSNFADLGFRFIFLRRDQSDGMPKEYENYISDLKFNPTLKEVANNRLGVLYEITNALPPMISCSNNEEVSHEKISSTLYKLKRDQNLNEIVMRNSYHPDWSFCNLEKEDWLYIRLLSCSAQKSELYLNINNSFSGKFDLKHAYIYYPDQIKFYVLLVISLIGIFSLLIVSLGKNYFKN